MESLFLFWRWKRSKLVSTVCKSTRLQKEVLRLQEAVHPWQWERRSKRKNLGKVCMLLSTWMCNCPAPPPAAISTDCDCLVVPMQNNKQGLAAQAQFATMLSSIWLAWCMVQCNHYLPANTIQMSPHQWTVRRGKILWRLMGSVLACLLEGTLAGIFVISGKLPVLNSIGNSCCQWTLATTNRIILQCNFCYVAELGQIPNTAETYEYATGEMKQSQSNYRGADMIPSPACCHDRAYDWQKPRKEKAVYATTARLPYGMFQAHYCLMTAHRLGHQCGLNWNWSFTDFWITSWHGLRGVWNSSSHHCWSLAHKSYSKLKSINKGYFENIPKEFKLFRAFIYTIHAQHTARCII